VYGLIDASGAVEVTIRENAAARMKGHGITPINWTTVAAELQRNWSLPTGKDLGRVFHDHYHSYGLLMDSFEAEAANVVQEGVLAASRTVPDNRLRPISLSRTGAGDRSHDHAFAAVRITSITSLGLDSIGTWLLSTS